METNGFSGGKQCVFTPANENSYVPSALGSCVDETEVAISSSLYLRGSAGRVRAQWTSANTHLTPLDFTKQPWTLFVLLPK